MIKPLCFHTTRTRLKCPARMTVRCVSRIVTPSVVNTELLSSSCGSVIDAIVFDFGWSLGRFVLKGYKQTHWKSFPMRLFVRSDNWG